MIKTINNVIVKTMKYVMLKKEACPRLEHRSPDVIIDT